MSLSPLDQTLQLVAWFVALIEFIIGLYILLLNIRHTANRHVSALLLTTAISTFALGLLLGASNVAQAAWPTCVQAALSPAIEPLVLLITVVLLRPQWLQGRWRRLWWPVYGLIFLPAVLTLADLALGTRLWYTGLDAETYTGGFVSLFEYAAGNLSLSIRVLNFYTLPVVAIVPLLYVALLGKKARPLIRRIAWLLLGTQIAGMIVQMGLRGLLSPVVRTFITGAVFVLVYAYAAFRQMISERRVQRGRLQTHLTVLILVVAVPVLVAVVAFVSARAGALIEQQPGADLSALRQFRQVSWAALAVGVTMLSGLAWLTIRQALRPIAALTDTATAIAAGDLTRTAPVESEDEIGVLALAFNDMTEQFRGLIDSLEHRVTERTAALERRTVQLQAAAEIAQAVTAVLNLDKLLAQVVILIRDRFDLYHVGLYLLDETERWADLQAVAGEAGQLLLEQGLRLEVGSSSMVGWCMAYAQPRVTGDVSREVVYLEHPLLPDARSEAALPLTARGRVIGALDVHQARQDAFSPEDVAVLKTLANQVAVAIDNVRLLTESQASLSEAQAVHRHYLREAWTGFTAAQASATGYRYAAGDVKADPDAWLPSMAVAQSQSRAVIVPDEDEDGATTLSLPITLRGETIGVLGFKKDGEWAESDVAVAQAAADRVALSLENVRLFDEVQRRARREAMVRQLTDKMRRITQVDAILDTAVQELGQALGSARAFVRLDVPSE